MSKTTFERLMENKKFKEKYEKRYKEFLLDELFLAMVENDDKSIRELAKEVGLSKRIIQDIKSGKQKDMRLSNFVNVANQLGYHVDLVKGKKKIPLNEYSVAM